MARPKKTCMKYAENYNLYPKMDAANAATGPVVPDSFGTASVDVQTNSGACRNLPQVGGLVE